MNIKLYQERLLKAARSAGFQSDFYCQIDDIGLPALTRQGNGDGLSIYLSSGVHGDERAGPMAILEALKSGTFNNRHTWTILPMINPRGLQNRRRESPEGIDINRDFGRQPRSIEARSVKAYVGNQTYDLAICLHEDYDGQGFYLYFHDRRSNPLIDPTPILKAAEPFCGIDLRNDIDGFPASEGHVHPPDSAIRAFGESKPEALWLFDAHAPVCFTLESPTAQPAAARIAAQIAALNAIQMRFA